jgi:uncharacterized protein (DUF305 family)
MEIKIDKKTALIAVGTGFLGIIIGLMCGFCMTSFHDRGEWGDRGREYQMHDAMLPPNRMMGDDMQSQMQGMMTGIQNKTGDEFDKAFLNEMIVHHQGAVQMAQSALQNAKHQEIKDLATGIISAQNKEIDQMKAWNSAWYSN